MSDVQESAQLLSGREFPVAILEALWNKAKIPAGKMMLVNVTPYDGWLEKICLEWGRTMQSKKSNHCQLQRAANPYLWTIAKKLWQWSCWRIGVGGETKT